MADDEINKKLQSLQQYVPFLNKMIAQLKDPTKPNREQQLAKITSLHSMITEKKKLKLATLVKCEEVILQLLNKAKSKAQTQVLIEEPLQSKSVKSEVKQAEVVDGERSASPTFTPPKKLVSSFLPLVVGENEIDKVNTEALVKDPATKIFVTKPSVFDRLGKRVFYQPKPVISFDQALDSFKKRLEEQGINLSEGNSNVEKAPLTITITGTVTTDANKEEKEKISRDEGPASDEKEDLKVERPRYRETSEEDLKKEKRILGEKVDVKRRRRLRDTSEETDNSRRGRSYDRFKERPKYRITSEEKERSKRSDSYDKRPKYRGTSEDSEDLKVSPIRDKYKLSKEKEDLKSRHYYKERLKHNARRNFRESSNETDDSKTSPACDKYKDNRRYRRSFEEDVKSYRYKERLKRRESSEESEDRKSRSYDKYKQRRKIKEKSEEREDKYAERRRQKEERRRSVYSRYIYKSSRRETKSNSWTETSHKIKISTENTSDKYNRITKDYKKYEAKRLEDRDRHKSLTLSELAKIKMKYQARLKTRPLKDSLKLEEISLSTEEEVAKPATSDVSESSMCDVDMTPVDMVLSPVNEENEIHVENPVTTTLPFPFPTTLLKSEPDANTTNNQIISSETSVSAPESATSQLLGHSNTYYDYIRNTEQTVVQNIFNEIPQLDCYPQGGIPIANPYIGGVPPILSLQQEVYRRPQTSNRIRVLREFAEQPPNIEQAELAEHPSNIQQAELAEQPSNIQQAEFTEQSQNIQQAELSEQLPNSQKEENQEVVVKREQLESSALEPKATESKSSDVQELTDDEKQMEIINKFLKKLLENETTRAAASVFIENVSNSLDDEKLKKAVNTVMSPKKQPRGRVVNGKLVLDDDEEVDSSKEVTKKKTRPVIDDDETEEEVTSTVRDERKPSKKKKSELDLLQEDLREMFIHDGILTSTGKRMCSVLKDDTDTDSKSSHFERRTRSLTKQFDMKSSKNQQQLRILRSARVVIPIDENLNKKKITKKACHSDEEDKDFHLRRRSRNPRRIEDSEEERYSPKRSHKTGVNAKKYVEEDSDDDKIALKQTNKISWSYAEDDSDDEETAKEGTKEYSLRQSGKVSWSYAEENSDDDKKLKQREEYSLRRSSKFQKCYIEIDSEDEMITKKVVTKSSKEKNKESPSRCNDDKTIRVKPSANVGSAKEKRNESLNKCDGKKGKGKGSSPNAENTKNQEQKAKVEEKASTTPKVIRRKKVSQWALGVIPKLKKKKKDESEEQKERDDSKEPKKKDDTKESNKSVSKSAREILELVEPDKNYWAPPIKEPLHCKLCDFNGKWISQHYKQKHSEYEVLCSRLKSSQAEKAIEASIKQKLDSASDDLFELKGSLKYAFQCCFCEAKITTYPIYFFDHISCHTGEFRHVCSECSYCSSRSKPLRTHYLRVHNKPRDNKPTILNVKSVFGYLCLECNYVQMNRKSVEDHVNIYHLGEEKKVIKIILSPNLLSKRRNKESGSNKKIVTATKKRKLKQIQDKSNESVQTELPAKKKKIEDQGNAMTLLSLLEDFEKNSERGNTNLQREYTGCDEETTDSVVRMNRNLEELHSTKEDKKAKETRESLTLKDLLNEKQIKQKIEIADVTVDRTQKEKLIRQKGAKEMGKKYPCTNLEKSKEKCVTSEKGSLELSESMKKKWQSLNLDELTIRILKRDTEESDRELQASLHTTEDLDKKVFSFEKEEMCEQSLETPPKSSDQEQSETTVKPLGLLRTPVKKMMKADMSVFTGKTDLEEENEKIDQERLRKMMQLNDTIKKKRQSLSIVEQLSNRLRQDKEKAMPVLEPQRVLLKETKPASKFPITPKKKTVVPPKDHGSIVMSAGFFDVFKKANELEFVCRVSPCSFMTKYRDTFVTHLNQDHVKINEEYKITECSACQGKIVPSSEKGFLKSFFLHMVDNHLDVKDNDQNVLSVKTIKRSMLQSDDETVNQLSQSNDDNVMRAGLLDIIKGTNTLKYICRVVFCTYSSKHRYPFITHWNQEHSSFRMTQCRLCGTEIAANAENNLLSNFFVHLDEEHLGVKSLKLPTSPFQFKISEVVSVDEDPTPSKQQDFVIESVVSLAEVEPAKSEALPARSEAEPTKSIFEAEPVGSEAEPVVSQEENKLPFVIGEVISLADDLESPGTSSKDQQSSVIESSTSLKETQDKPSFVIENVVSLAEKPKAWKSESALKAFLQHPGEVYKCPQFYCHFVSDNRQFFDIHVNSHGAKDSNEMVCCVYCDVKTSMNSAGHHIDTHHQNCLFSCSQCLYRALRKEYVIVHMKLKHKTASSIISLPKPLKSFKSQDKCHSLNETCHPYRCGHKGCLAEFLFQSDYTIHLERAHCGAMICGYSGKQINCHYRSAKADSMIDHWRTHNCYSFHCLICQVGSMELYTMLEHYAFTHPNRAPSIVDRRRGPGNEMYGYNGQAFAKIKYVTNEVFCSLGIKHYNIVSTDSKKDDVIQIDDDTSVKAKNDVGDEMLLNKFGQLCEPMGNQLRCPLCVHFKTKKISYFIYHLLFELKCHRFKCNSCDYCCITYGAMAIHCQDEHKLTKIANVTQSPIDKPVQFWIELVLNYQAKVITSKFSFELGEESQSTDRNFPCDVCHKWFEDMDTLQRHELYHWAELTYICRICRCRRPSFNEILKHTESAHTAPRNFCIARVPSVTKVISNWKSFTSQTKEESVTVFQPVQRDSNDGQKVLVLPSSSVGQQDAVLYSCLHCSTAVRSVEMLQKHNVEAHDGKTDNFKCKVLTKSKDEVMLLAFVLP